MLAVTRSISSRILPSVVTKVTSKCSYVPTSFYVPSFLKSLTVPDKKVTTYRNYATNPYLKIHKNETGPTESMDMIAQIPPVVVPGKVIGCDGGNGPLGHPRIFIALDIATLERPATCEYCGLRFVSESQVSHSHKEKDLQRGIDYLEPEDVPDWDYNVHSDGHH